MYFKNAFYCLGGFDGDHRRSLIGRYSNGAWTKLTGQLNIVRVGVRAVVIDSSIRGEVEIEDISLYSQLSLLDGAKITIMMFCSRNMTSLTKI